MKYSVWNRIVLLATLAICQGCPATVLVVKKTRPERPMLLENFDDKGAPKKVIFLSPIEATCPNQCSASMGERGYKLFVSFIEKVLLQHGFELISGAIVSRVERQLTGNETREKWDRTEKALLLGKDTGASAIFEVRSIYVDIEDKTYLKESGSRAYSLRPARYAQQVIKSDPDALIYSVPIWTASAELRMLDMDGKVIWSGTKSIRSTDIMPDSWQVKLAKSEAKGTARKVGNVNFDYFMYFHDEVLQAAQMKRLVRDLIRQIPPPVELEAEVTPEPEVNPEPEQPVDAGTSKSRRKTRSLQGTRKR